MTNGAGAAGAAASAAAAEIANAIKASGAILRVDPHDFLNIVHRQNKPLIACAQGGFLSKNYQYLSAYKGLIFFTKSPTPLNLPTEAELISAKKIWIPS
ncbi:MAG: hypothetical protein PVG93_01090 [Phycisphaerales bacterium]|jgi:hypothetical protein